MTQTESSPQVLACIEMPIETPNPVNGTHGHWTRARARRKSQRTNAFLMMRPVDLPCVVTLTRLSAGTLDDDNLRPALKSVRDGIADRLGIADNDPRVEWRYAQARAKRGQFGVVVEVTR